MKAELETRADRLEHRAAIADSHPVYLYESRDEIPAAIANGAVLILPRLAPDAATWEERARTYYDSLKPGP